MRLDGRFLFWPTISEVEGKAKREEKIKNKNGNAERAMRKEGMRKTAGGGISGVSKKKKNKNVLHRI